MGDTMPNDDDRDEVDRVARLLIAEWERVEHKPVNVSYVATFADMARVIIADRARVAPTALLPRDCDLEEAAFWQFDSLHKRPGMPMSERDAFKTTMRTVLEQARAEELAALLRLVETTPTATPADIAAAIRARKS